MSLVSVITPLYNAESLIGKAVQSILDQTYSNWELLICDDGSSDASLAVATALAQKDDRIKVIFNETNRGHLYTYNRLFFEARGTYVMVQDADDWSDKERIQKQVTAIENHQVGLSLTNSVFYSTEGRIYEQPSLPTGLIDHHTEEKWAPATLMFKREILKKIPGFNKYFDRLTSMDRYFILEMLYDYKGYYIDEVLYHVLARPESDHRSIDEKHIRKLTIMEAYKLLKQQRVETGTDWLKEGKQRDLLQYEQKFLADRLFLSEKYRLFSCIQIDASKMKQGWKLLKKAIAVNPLSIKNYQTLFYFLRQLVRNK